MSQDERFWKWISNLYKILMATSAFTAITSPLTSNPIGPIVGIVILSGCYFVYRHFKRIKKITGIFSRKARIILVLILVIFISIGTYGFLRSIFPPNITINNLQDGDEVQWKYSVRGSSSWEAFASRIWPEGLGLRLHIYALVFPVESNGPWWVQDPAIVRSNGNWEVYAYFGRDPAEYPEDIGDPFRVCAIITKEKLQTRQSFQDLPDYISVSEIYQVTRSAPLGSPVAQISAEPIMGRMLAFFGYDSYDPDGGELIYSWDFGNGENGTGEATNHIYANEGSYTVTLTVTDDEGDIGITSTQVVVGLLPPVAQISAEPITGVAPLEVRFSGENSYDPDGSPGLFHFWDFGDGENAFSYSTTITHTYVNEGSYNATLAVTDDELDIDIASIQITAMPPTLVFDDFNDGVAGSNLGGEAGAMSPGGEYDPVVEFSSDAKEGAYALSLTYDFPSDQWCGYWVFTNDGEASSYDVGGDTEIRMWVKGAKGGERFKIELADVVYDPKNYEATKSHKYAVQITSCSGFAAGVTTSWQEAVIHLPSFSGVDMTRLKQVCIVFDESPNTGTVYLDDIRFC